jgi:hypothetical protein
MACAELKSKSCRTVQTGHAHARVRAGLGEKAHTAGYPPSPGLAQSKVRPNNAVTRDYGDQLAHTCKPHGPLASAMQFSSVPARPGELRPAMLLLRTNRCLEHWTHHEKTTKIRQHAVTKHSDHRSRQARNPSWRPPPPARVCSTGRHANLTK